MAVQSLTQTQLESILAEFQQGRDSRPGPKLTRAQLIQQIRQIERMDIGLVEAFIKRAEIERGSYGAGGEELKRRIGGR